MSLHLDEIEYAVDRLTEHFEGAEEAKAGGESEREAACLKDAIAFTNKLQQEPLRILKKSAGPEVGEYFADLEGTPGARKVWAAGKVRDLCQSAKKRSSIQVLAADLLARLVYIECGPSWGWRMNVSQLDKALLYFIQERSEVEWVRTNRGRREGGKVTAGSRKRSKLELHNEIRRQEQLYLAAGREPSTISTLLAHRFNLSASQIRRVIKTRTR